MTNNPFPLLVLFTVADQSNENLQDQQAIAMRRRAGSSLAARVRGVNVRGGLKRSGPPWRAAFRRPFDRIGHGSYANQRIVIHTGAFIDVKTFGQIIAEARKALGISQKDLAAKIRKEDGEPISPHISTTSSTTGATRRRVLHRAVREASQAPARSP